MKGLKVVKLDFKVYGQYALGFDKLFDHAEKAMISLDRIVLIESTKDFTEKFFDFAIIFIMYKDGLISEGEFQAQKSVYEESDNPQFILAKDLLE